MNTANLQICPEIVVSHPGTDFDSLASMWACHLLHPTRPVVIIGAEDSNVREYLALYGREFPRLRLKEIDIGAVKHVTVVDCSSRSQLARIEGLLDRSNITIELWDHHREAGPDFRVDQHHFAPVGANTTMLMEELEKAGILPSENAATLFMLGIYEDTGSLRFPTTTPADLHAVEWLMRAGASLDVVDKFLDIRLTQAQKSLLTTLSLNTRVVEVKGIPIHVTQAAAHEFVDEIAYLARKVQETESADVLFALVQLNERVFIVGRSRLPAVDVGRILSIFGGGGHAQAASCLLTGTTHPVALQRLIDAVREQIQPTISARDIMSYPVKTVDPEATIAEADAVIARTGHSGLVVTDADNHILGIITRREVDKALGHGLGHAPVRGYMVRDPVTVGEDTGLGELQSAIIERHAGFLPVMFAGKLSGIVTRSDVLRAIHKATSRGRAGLAEASPVREATDKGRELLSLLPPRYVSILAAAGEVADAIGVACYLVGGIVRDLVLDRRNIDIDFLVEGDGIAFAKKLGATLEAHVVENSRFRTAKISLSDGLHIDIATAREEFYLHPGALPEVEAASIRDDLLRRDFTINTLAIQLNSRKWGLLIDHFGGLSDLNIGLIRVLHTFSFVDDPTRILRALRFSARYGFPLEKQTEELLKRALLEGRLDDVSPERLRAEILLCLRESNPWAVLRRICDQGVFGLLHPPLQPPLCMSEPEDQIKPALEWVAGFMDAQDVPRRSLVYFAYLISTTLSADAIGFVQHYRFDSTVMEIAKSLEDLRGAEVELADRDLKPSRIVAILENLPAPFWVVLASGKSDISPERAHIRRFLTELRWTQPEISGDDLVTEGFEPGPRFGEALDAIRRAKLDGEISGREEEIAIAKRLLAGK